MTAADIALVLRGRRSGDGWLCRCPLPSHGQGKGDRRPSLSVRDGDEPGRVLLTCFGGCDRRDVLAELKRRDLLDAIDRRPTIWKQRRAPPREHWPDPDALAVWRAGKLGEGSIVETYLRRRGIALPVPPSLRCGVDRHDRPMMVAAVQRPSDGAVIAVQTTLLTPAGDKAAVAFTRRTIAALGVGAVRLGRAGDVLGIAEGVETALAAMQLSGIPTWAALGCHRMHRVDIPASVRSLVVFADADTPGLAAAERTADRHRREGRGVAVRWPPEGCEDWADAAAAAAHRPPERARLVGSAGTAATVRSAFSASPREVRR